MIRVFIALNLSKKTHTQLSQLSKNLQTNISNFKWSNTDQAHLTLNFLGDIDEALLPSLEQALRQALKSAPVFDLKLGRLGGFPSLGRCRILWIGLDSGLAGCSAVKVLVDQALSEVSIRPESKPFKPHVTLARSKSGKIVDLDGKFFRESFSSFPIDRIDVVSIYKSDLQPSGPIHTRLAEIPLAG